jgi:hypothetical protein
MLAGSGHWHDVALGSVLEVLDARVPRAER